MGLNVLLSEFEAANQNQLFGKMLPSSSSSTVQTPENILKKYFAVLLKRGEVECMAAVVAPKFMVSSRTCGNEFIYPYEDSYGVIGKPQDQPRQMKGIKEVIYPKLLKRSEFPGVALIEVSSSTYC